VIRDVDGLRALAARPRRLLAVFAHPDDESYGVAGTLARVARDPAAAVVLLCLTRGEASSVARERDLEPEAMGRLREERLLAVADVLGLDGLLVPGLPDGRLARLELARLAAVVRDALVAFRPDVVVAHDPRGVNGHPDHVASHWAVRRALEGLPATRLAMVAYPRETAEAVQPRLLFPTADEEIDVTIALDAGEVAAKERCLRIHEAHVTLLEDAPEGLLHRPPVEHFDLLGEAFSPPVDDLFAGA
jgi:LmbE family N-acetylglucosaminyl deacetylase